MSNHHSDSEDDPDWVPPAGDDDDSDTEPKAKRLRQASPQPLIQVDEEAKKKERQSLWESFEKSVASGPSKAPSPRRMVTIEKRYRFAGEDVVEIKEVLEDSEDARKWPLHQPPATSDIAPTSSDIPSSSLVTTPDAPAAPAASSSTAGQPAEKHVARPGPRKPKKSLPSLPGAQKPKKLTTLGMSAIEWRTHVETIDKPDLKDELDAHRKGGGYLEKVEFLQRVEDRKQEALDATKSKRRRT